MKKLRGKRILITGGAQGIGFAIAEQLAAKGAEIILTDINETNLDDAKRRLETSGARIHTYTLDVTVHEQIAELRETIRGEVGPIDVLVNNAGIVFGGPFLEVPLEQHVKTYRVNAEGPVAVTHYFLPDLIAAAEGHVVNVSSASGLIALPQGAAYASSKWAVIGFSESLRIELKRSGAKHVGVTTVCPSYVATGMFEGVKPPFLTRFLTADALAKNVVHAVRKNRPFVLEPWLVKVTPFVMGTMPIPVRDMISDVLGATGSMESWRGHGGH